MSTAAGESLSKSPDGVRPRQAAPAATAVGDWRAEMRAAFRDPNALLEHLDLPPESPIGANNAFGLLAPRPYVDRIRPGNRRDPLLLQVLPDPREDQESTGFVPDPVGERDAAIGPGLLQKYHGRVLWMLTPRCAVHCRYCFRREYPYSDQAVGPVSQELAVSRIAADPSLSEVILSGGDPLTLSDERLNTALTALNSIAHVRRVRIHTRLPIVIPSRVTDSLLSALQSTRLAIVLVLHANHSNEIDDAVAAATGDLRRREVMLLNQSVLLRGVNDDASSLAALSERLLDVGVTPYYLHELDHVTGAAHFKTAEDSVSLVDALRRRLPGYAVPRLVRESPGEPSKTPIA